MPTALTLDHPRLMDAADEARHVLDSADGEAVVAFRSDSGPTGALLLRNLPIGPTPITPSASRSDGVVGQAELVLLGVARLLGEPVGYAPELGGSIVQDIVPVPGTEAAQVSTSSAVTLAWHTETAFHPDAPHYLLLLCRRGDPTAATRLCSIHDLLDGLSSVERALLAEPRFQTRPDASFLKAGSTGEYGPPTPVLVGSGASLRFTYDQDLMVGTDAAAQEVLERLGHLVDERHSAVVLEAGDLLIVDNTVAVHGRSPFQARYDGADRWLQRAFVVDDLAPSAGRRVGRVVTTRF